MRKGALFEMKMRCADPAGFPSKWRHVISMHGGGRRRPEAPLFNYTTFRGGACDGSGAEMGGLGRGGGGGGGDGKLVAGTAGIPARRSPGGTRLR